MIEQGTDDFHHVRLAFTQTLKSRLVAGFSGAGLVCFWQTALAFNWDIQRVASGCVGRGGLSLLRPAIRPAGSRGMRECGRAYWELIAFPSKNPTSVSPSHALTP